MDSAVDEKRLASFGEYAERHELFDLLQFLTRQLLLASPSDPLGFLIDQLKTPRTPHIFIIGTPASNRSQVCQRLATALKLEHTSTDALLRRHIASKSALGQQVRGYVERGEMVPDAVMCEIAAGFLDELPPSRGFVLEGFPQTAEQAFFMQRRGVIPTHLVALRVADAAVLAYNDGFRVDPVTNTTYHLQHAPPRSSEIAARLEQRKSFAHDAVAAGLHAFRAHLEGVARAYPTLLKTLECDAVSEGEQQDAVVQRLLELVEQRRVSQGDKQFRIVLAGLPGSGKTSVAQLLASKYDLVHVSPRSVILEAQDDRDSSAAELLGYLDAPEFAPDARLAPLITARLQRPDAQERGWVLEGWPLTEAQVAALETAALRPNRVILLRVPPETALSRLRDRRFHAETGRRVHAPPADAPGYVSRPADSEPNVQKRVQAYGDVERVLEAAYGKRTRYEGQFLDDRGLLEPVQADGVGEGDGLGVANYYSRNVVVAGSFPEDGPSTVPRASSVPVALRAIVRADLDRQLEPSLLRAFERVENAVLCPVHAVGLGTSSSS